MMVVSASVELALRLHEVSRSFGPILALRGISLEIPVGERVALLGPNGAGKTTLVRALCRRIRIDRGEIEVLGKPIAATDSTRALGVVPQDLAIYGDLTARENLKSSLLIAEQEY